MDCSVQRDGTASLILIVVPTITFIAQTTRQDMEGACLTVKPAAMMDFTALLDTIATARSAVRWDQRLIVFHRS
jgi:hypothetical protein